jgi:hypothetical protein
MNWVEIWRAPSWLEALTIKDLLESHSIPVHTVDQQDRVYAFLGEIRIYIPASTEEDARQLMTIKGFFQDPRLWN